MLSGLAHDFTFTDDVTSPKCIKLNIFYFLTSTDVSFLHLSHTFHLTSINSSLVFVVGRTHAWTEDTDSPSPALSVNLTWRLCVLTETRSVSLADEEWQTAGRSGKNPVQTTEDEQDKFRVWLFVRRKDWHRRFIWHHFSTKRHVVKDWWRVYFETSQEYVIEKSTEAVYIELE